MGLSQTPPPLPPFPPPPEELPPPLPPIPPLVQDAVGAGTLEIKTRVFISYSRKDMAFADRIDAALKARGFEILIDREEIYAFENWWKRIQALIGGADTVIFVLSPEAVKSDVALKEVAHAASLNKRFAPIVCRRVEDAAVPEALRRLNFIFFDDPEQFKSSIDRLAEALQTDIGWVRRHTEFGDAAHRWAEAGRPGGMLLRPPILDQAEAWLTLRPGGAPAPTAETNAFIAQSRKAMLGTRRLQQIALGSIFSLMMIVILGLVGVINQDLIKKQWTWYAIDRPFLAATIWPYVLDPAADAALKAGAGFRECAARAPGNDYCPDMVVVPAGSFLMGSPAAEQGQNSTEEPQHTVTITKPFAVSKYELTFAEWDTCAAHGNCAKNIYDGGFGRDQRPVVNIAWDDARQYVAWLSKVTGETYRLLSEAEYEYATRAGTQTAYPWGDDIKLNGVVMANCDGCGGKWNGGGPAPVGTFPPNKFGLYDMVGNVSEWVEDCAHFNYTGAPTDGSVWLKGGDCKVRIIRGGSWSLNADDLRSGSRNGTMTDGRNSGIGFRVARTLLNP